MSGWSGMTPWQLMRLPRIRRHARARVTGCAATSGCVTARSSLTERQPWHPVLGSRMTQRPTQAGQSYRPRSETAAPAKAAAHNASPDCAGSRYRECIATTARIRLRQAPPAVAAWVRPNTPATERPDLGSHTLRQGRAEDVPPAADCALRKRPGRTEPLAKLELGIQEQPLHNGTAVSFGAAFQGNRTRLVALRGTHLDQLPQQSDHRPRARDERYS